MIQKYFAIIFIIGIIFATTNYVYAQETKNVTVEIKYTNGDIVDFYETELVIYQNLQNTPIIKTQITSNPYTISLPAEQKYKIDVFTNGMHGATDFVDLKKDSVNTVINIPLSGGIKFNIFFENGHDPVKGATVAIKSHDGKKWRESQTNAKGETIRHWIQSTTKEADHYIAEVYLGNILAKTVSNIKIQKGIAQDQKIIIPIPKIIDDLITITLFKSPSEKISKNDGEYIVTLSKINSDFSKKSTATFRGESNFYNLEPGEYTVSVSHVNEEWEEKTITVIGNQNEFKINKIIQSDSVDLEDKSDKSIQSCNCVAFRLDDVQDYWLNNIQKAYVKKFLDDDIPLTVGIIANSFGDDPVITDVVKEGIKKDVIKVANHGTDNEPLEGLSKEEQTRQIQDSGNVIADILKVHPKVLIPPQNRFDDATKQVLTENGYTHISSSTLFDNNFPYPLANQTLYRFPEIATTGKYDAETTLFVGVDHAETFQNTITGMEKYGFVVITSHPQEFSMVKDGIYINEINAEQFSQLELLIDAIKSQGIKIVTIDTINEDSDDATVPTWVKNNAKWWADGSIDDDLFVQGIQFLIKEKIMKIPPTQESTAQESTTDVKNIPDWIKNNAKWWADGSVSDSDFIKGMEFLIKNQILKY